MRHQAQRGHAARLRQSLGDVVHLVRLEAEPVHPGIDLDEHFQRAGQACRLQHAHLLVVVHDNGETARRDLRQLAGAEKTLEQQDSARIVLLAQRDRGVELEQRETVGIGERRQHPHQAVSIGVRLDHGQHLRARRALARDVKIGAQCGQIDLCEDRTRHGQTGAGSMGEPWPAGLV